MTTPRVSSARVESLFEQAREPVFVIGEDGRVVYVNPSWEKKAGRSADTILGLNCLPNSSIASTHLDLAQLAESLAPPPEAWAGATTASKALLINADGNRLWCRIEFVPLHAIDGSIHALLGFLREPDAHSSVPESEQLRLRFDLLEARHRIANEWGIDSLVGAGPHHRRLLDQIKTAAGSDSPVSIVGPPGVGKRLVARTIHQKSARRHAPLIPLDCSALPPEVIERELFRRDVNGTDSTSKLSMNQQATLLLLNVTELHRDLQAQLAKALTDGVRLIATSEIGLDEANRLERLRRDFYFVLTTFNIVLPSLSERKEDIGLLAQHFLERTNRREEAGPMSFEPRTIEALSTYAWPGNVAELARVVDAAHAHAKSDLIQLEDLPADLFGVNSANTSQPLAPMESLDELMTRVERRLIIQALERSRQNKSRAAELLEISRPRLYRRIKELNIPDVPDAMEVLHGDMPGP